MAYGGLQLEMNFDSSINRFRNCLDNGVFLMLIEQNAPGKDTDPVAAAEKLAEIEYTVLNINEIPTGLAITDKYSVPDTWKAAEYAATLSNESRDRHVIYISGRNSTMEEVADQLKLCAAGGFTNVVPATGSSFPGEGIKETRRRPFADSTNILSTIDKIENSPFYPGCVTNPFKYTPGDLFPQYFKLVKKLNLGANFIVSQFGWDMLKLQELRWYLNYRSMHYPTIARLLLLTPEKVEKILHGNLPGVHISPDFQVILENELKYSYTQFEAAQWRRLELQAAGCRLLGYSGIQIAGLDSPDKVRVASKRIAAALDEFNNFQDWAHEYHEHLARAEMAPYPYCFYMFDKLFSRAHLDGIPKMSDVAKEELTGREKTLFKLRKFMFPRADLQNPGAHLFAKKILCGCRECSHCRLPQTFFVCPEQCPKGLANGPCGGTRADGSCELGGMPCTHMQMMRLAVWQNAVDMLEEHYIEPVSRNLH
jgi:methylenetetrahydrofolate reductase (NADPH)